MEIAQDIRVCAFCTNRADSKEHWPPKWTQGKLNFITNIRHEVSIGQSSPESGLFHQSGVSGKTLKMVCTECNNGWMSSNIERSKTVIENLHKNAFRFLSNLDKGSLYDFFILEKIIVEFADYNTISVTKEERCEFREGVLRDKEWNVYVGFLEYSNMTSLFNHVSWNNCLSIRRISRGDLIHNPPLFSSSVTMLKIGHLVAIVQKDIKTISNEKLNVFGLFQLQINISSCFSFNRLTTIFELNQAFLEFIPAAQRDGVRFFPKEPAVRRSGRRRSIFDLALAKK